MKKQNLIRCGISLVACLQMSLPRFAHAEMPNTITISQSTAGQIRILFHGLPGELAALQTTKGLGISHWTTLTFAVVQTNGVAAFSDVVEPNAPGRFYRVAVPGNARLSLRLTAEEDELLPIVLAPTNSPGETAVGAFITELPKHGQLFQFDGAAISNTPALVTDSSLRVQFQAARDENGTNYAAFRFVLGDSAGSLEAGEATLDVNPVPDAPGIVFPWTVETAEDTPVIFQLPIIDPDLDQGGDTIRISIVDPVPCISLQSLDCLGQLYQVENDDLTRGALIDQPNTPVTNPRGLLMFVPKADAHGGTIFLPQLEDSYGLRSDLHSVWLHVLQVNDPPTAASQTNPVQNSQGYGVIYPFVNDVDPGHYQALEIRLLSLPETGRLMLGGVTPATTNDWLPASSVAWAWYVPVPDDCAAPIPVGTNIASFHYIVRDPVGATAVAREQLDIIDVNVSPVPTWPVAVTNVEDTTFEAATNSPIVIHLDDRDEDRVYFFIVRPPAHGRLFFQSRDETWRFVTASNFQVLDSFYPGEHPRFFYVPDPDFHTDGREPDRFSFRVTDWQLNTWRCEPVVNLYVTGVNDSPVAQSEVLTNDMNQTLSVTLVATDPEGKLEKVNILSSPHHGTLTGAPPNVLYIPNAGFSGIDAFTFNAVDNAGATSAIATVTIHVIPLCVAPPGGLIHWWRSESNGLDSAGMNHGSLQGGLDFDPGKTGTAFHFDGADDWFHIKAPAVALDWTAVFWLNRQDSPDASAALLMDSTSALKLEQYGSMSRNVGVTQFGVADHTFNYTVPVNEWTHLAFVGTGSGITLYVNGAWQDALPISIPLPLESLGGPAGDRLKGLVDEIAVFKRALAAEEIQQLHDAGLTGMCVGSP
jgi:hypothetical protein